MCYQKQQQKLTFKIELICNDISTTLLLWAKLLFSKQYFESFAVIWEFIRNFWGSCRKISIDLEMKKSNFKHLWNNLQKYCDIFIQNFMRHFLVDSALLKSFVKLMQSTEETAMWQMFINHSIFISDPRNFTKSKDYPLCYIDLHSKHCFWCIMNVGILVDIYFIYEESPQY